MGYQICKSYYSNAADKKEAIKQIIQLNYSDSNAVENFLIRSNYYTEPINKTVLVTSYEAMRPSVITTAPFSNADTLVDPAITELKILFSKPMKDGYSISMGKNGKDAYPVTGAIGFSEDKKTFTVKTALQPHHEYDFIITGRSFASAEGYPLVNYRVSFKTK